MTSSPRLLESHANPPETVGAISFARDGRDHWSSDAARVRPVAVLRIALLLLVVGNVGRIPILQLGDRAAPLLINDLVVGAALVTGFLYMLGARSLRLNDVSFAGMTFAMIGGLSAVSAIPRFGLSGFEVLGSLAYLARWAFYFAIYVVIINCARARDAEALWGALERAMLLIAAFGIVQAIFLPNFAFMVYSAEGPFNDWDVQGHRLVSTILEPNVAAGMLGATLVVQLAQLGSGVRVALWKPMLVFAALLMTVSRGGMLAFFVGASVVLSVLGLRKRLAKLALLIVALLIPALPMFIGFAQSFGRFTVSDSSAYSRVMAWRYAFATFSEYPWFGIGFNTYGYVAPRLGFEAGSGIGAFSSEGGLLFVAVMTGIVGVAVFTGMLWLAMRRFRIAWRHPESTPVERGLLIGTYAATVLIFVDTLFVNTLFVPFAMEMLWALWGVSFLIAADIRRRAAAV